MEDIFTNRPNTEHMVEYTGKKMCYTPDKGLSQNDGFYSQKGFNVRIWKLWGATFKGGIEIIVAEGEEAATTVWRVNEDNNIYRYMLTYFVVQEGFAFGIWLPWWIFANQWWQKVDTMI